MNSSTSPTQTPSCEGLEQLFEQVAGAIGRAQAALLAGRFRDLETYVLQQLELCTTLEMLVRTNAIPKGNRAKERAVQVRNQNLIFAAALRRMQRHSDTLRHLMCGLASSYGPSRTSVIGQVS